MGRFFITQNSYEVAVDGVMDSILHPVEPLALRVTLVGAFNAVRMSASGASLNPSRMPSTLATGGTADQICSL